MSNDSAGGETRPHFARIRIKIDLIIKIEKKKNQTGRWIYEVRKN